MSTTPPQSVTTTAYDASQLQRNQQHSVNDVIV
jgi:hypothetical protein